MYFYVFLDILSWLGLESDRYLFSAVIRSQFVRQSDLSIQSGPPTGGECSLQIFNVF